MMDAMDETEALDHIREIVERLPDCRLKVILIVVLGAFASDEQGVAVLFHMVRAFAIAERSRISRFPDANQ